MQPFRCRSIIAAVAILALKLSPAAMAQKIDAETALQRLFAPAPIEEAWFAPNFLAHVPAGQVQQIVDDLERKYGPLREISGEGDTFTVALDRADIPTRIVLDAEGRITGLLFQAPVATTGSLKDHVAAIAELPGQTSVLVLTDGEIRAAHAPEQALAAGSAGKLAILEALEAAVTAGRLRWDQIVLLDSSRRSLPSGILQDWPAGTPVTIATLANLMISLSDNTATDALLHLVGREAVEAVSPRNAPFLSTRELFTLKADTDLREAWMTGDEAGRREILDAIAERPVPQTADLPPEPTLGIEWFFSATELCQLLQATADLPAFDINPGVADRQAWKSVAFKGGSEPGVLNLSTQLVAEDGTTHCVIATWNNDEALDDEQMFAPYRAILQALRPDTP